MDWETLYCPNGRCEHYGKPFKIGWLVRNGSSRGESQARCQGCGSSVTLSYGTAYYGLGTDPLIFETALRALAEGIRCGPPPGLSRWTKNWSEVGWIEPHANAVP